MQLNQQLFFKTRPVDIMGLHTQFNQHRDCMLQQDAVNLLPIPVLRDALQHDLKQPVFDLCMSRDFIPKQHQSHLVDWDFLVLVHLRKNTGVIPTSIEHFGKENEHFAKENEHFGYENERHHKTLQETSPQLPTLFNDQEYHWLFRENSCHWDQESNLIAHTRYDTIEIDPLEFRPVPNY